MRRNILGLICLLVVPAAASAADPKLDDLMGKWELTADAGGLPKGAVFDFQKNGKVVVSVDVNGQQKSFDFKYSLKGKLIKFDIDGKEDTTEIVKLDKDALECKDKDSKSAKFKRVK